MQSMAASVHSRDFLTSPARPVSYARPLQAGRSEVNAGDVLADRVQASPADWRDRWAPRVPYLILAYIAALAALRLALSPYLELDEAHFVGRVDWRLVYGDSHPPLYNWLTRAALELTGWRWPLAGALVKYGLLAAYHLLIWDSARRLAGARAALFATAAAAFLPQVVWMSAVTLTHSVLVMAAAAAVVHAAILADQTRRTGAWVWLGFAMAAGVLAKFNFLLFLAPFLIVLAAIPATAHILRDRRFRLSLLILGVLVLPVLAAIASDLAASTERFAKLYADRGATQGIDLPYIGLNGFLSLIQACLAWAGPALLFWIVARRAGGAATPGAPAPIIRAIGGAMVLSLAIFALIVLAGDVTQVRERYVTPMLAILPVWLAAAFPIRARWVAGLAAAAYLAVLPGFAGMVTFSGHRLAFPYAALATEIRAGFDIGGGAIMGVRDIDVANLSLLLDLPVALDEGGDGPPPSPILLIWTGDGPPGDKHAALIAARGGGEAFVLRAGMENFSDKRAVFSVILLPAE
jgi:hypothetical protein